MNEKKLTSPAGQRTLGELALKYGVYVALTVLLVFNAIFTRNFLNINVVWNIMIQSATTLLVSLGMTIVIAGGGINLAVGSIMSVASVMTAFMLQQTDSIAFSITAAILVSLVCGVLIGGTIAVFKIQPMIATLAFLTLLRGVSMLFPNTGLIRVNNRAFMNIALYRIFGIFPVQIVIIAVSVLLVSLLMRRMSFGRYVEAIGDNESAARYAGIRISLITLVMYVLSSLLAGMAGILETARIAASNGMSVGKMIEMDAVASTVIGGTPLSGGKPNIVGTMIGVFIMQIITIMVNMNNITYEYSMVIKAAIILLAVFIQKIDRKA